MDNKELREIYLYNNGLEDLGMDNFGKMLQNKPNMFAIGLEFNKIGANGASQVLTSIKNLQVFEKLYLNNNEIKLSVREALIECLSEAINLKEIRLSNNKLGDEGGLALALAL